MADRWGYSGDGGDAGQALLGVGDLPVAVAADGTVYIADEFNEAVRVVSPDGVINTLPVTYPEWAAPSAVALDAGGALYIAMGQAVHRRNPDGTTTVAVAVDPAGTVFVAGHSPVIAAAADDKVRPVTNTEFVNALAAGPDGSVYVPNGGRVDRIHPDGATVTVAGIGVQWPGDEPLPDVDGEPASGSVLDPGDVAISPTGELYLTSGPRVYRVDRDGTLRFVADVEDADDFREDEYTSLAIAVTRDGEIYLADSLNDRVFAVNGEGEVRTFAGNGESAYSDEDRGDGAQATDAPVRSPEDLAVAPDGTVYIATSHGIRRVSTDGEIDTVAERQDGKSPTGLALDVNGNLYFTTPELHRVFVVVRPGELAQPFPWGVLWWSLAAVVLLGAVGFGVLRHRRRPKLDEAQPAE